MSKTESKNDAAEMVARHEYLRNGGWLQNNRCWWHPPYCTASWPESEAMEMARRDEAEGRRMKPEAVREYLREMKLL